MDSVAKKPAFPIEAAWHDEVVNRLDSMRRAAMAVFHGGSDLSAASRGTEREFFVNSILRSVFSPTVRFGSGDVIDSFGAKTGQLDVVVEVPTMFSLPTLPGSPRLFFAEGVSAVLEIKSNLATQWKEVEDTAKKTQRLRRMYDKHRLAQQIKEFEIVGPKGEPGQAVDEILAVLRQRWVQMPDGPPERIPIYAVGFTGWKTLETLQTHVANLDLDGALVLDAGIFHSVSRDHTGFGYNVEQKSTALLALFSSLAHTFQMVSEFPNPMLRYLGPTLKV
jgi:hypothetical protein